MHIYWLIPDFYFPFDIYEESRFYPTSASSPPIQFNSILARRTAFRLKEFFFKKYLLAARVALKLRSS